jgi:hypothetical protein
VNVQSIWKVKLVDISNNSTCSVASKIISVTAQALRDHRINLCGHPSHPKCCCRTIPWLILCEGLAVCRDKPADVVDLLHPWDWTAILQRPDAPVALADDGSSVRLHYAMCLFVWLHRWPVRLLKENHNNPKAQEVLKKLGSSDTLLRLVLHRIIAGEMSSTTGACMSLDDLEMVVSFLMRFLHCLTPIPWDRDIDSLVCHARSTIMEALTTIVMNRMSIMTQDPETFTKVPNGTNDVLLMIEKWEDMHQESDEARWQRFYSLYLTQEANPDDNKAYSKLTLKERKKQVKASTNLTEGRCVPIATCSQRRSKTVSSNAGSVG